jgi:hypothetical protein
VASVRGVSLQPIETTEVAARVVELLGAGPAGRVPDIGGPEQHTLDELIAIWQHVHGTRKPVWHLPVRGRTIAAFRSGHHLAALPGYGRRTFSAFAVDAARFAREATR